MKILITRYRFSLDSHLTAFFKRKIPSFGIDNINNYYDTNLKKYIKHT